MANQQVNLVLVNAEVAGAKVLAFIFLVPAAVIVRIRSVTACAALRYKDIRKIWSKLGLRDPLPEQDCRAVAPSDEAIS